MKHLILPTAFAVAAFTIGSMVPHDPSSSAQTAPPGSKAPTEQLTVATMQIATVEKMLTFLSLDNGAMATDLAGQIKQQVIPQIQAFQQRQAADAKKVADEAKAATPAPAEPVKP